MNQHNSIKQKTVRDNTRQAFMQWPYRLIQSACFLICTLVSLDCAASPKAPNNDVFEREFVIALSAQPDDIIPNNSMLISDITLEQYLFDQMFTANEDKNYQSNIIKTYKAIEPTVWQFTLKPGLRFADGKALTAKDIVFSLDQVRTYSPQETAGVFEIVRSYRVLDEYTLEIRTYVPFTYLPDFLMNLSILQQQKTLVPPEEFMQRKAYIGSGPYQFVEQLANGDIRLRANPYYHGKAPYLQRVRLTAIPDVDARVEALRSQQVDLIEKIPSTRTQELLADEDVDIVSAPAVILVLLNLDAYRHQSPFVLDHQGQPLQDNPLKKKAVRQAISMAINRHHLASNSAGVPTEQLAMSGRPGYLSSLQADGWHPQKARALLKQAGYPNGFRLIFHYTNDAGMGLHNAQAIVQTITKDLARIGITAKPEQTDIQTFIKNDLANEYALSIFSAWFRGASSTLFNTYSSVTINGYNPDTTPLENLDTNRNDNHAIMDLAAASDREFDTTKRMEIQLKIVELIIQNKAIIPLYFQKSIWALRNDLGVELWRNPLGMTLAQDIHKSVSLQETE